MIRRMREPPALDGQSHKHVRAAAVSIHVGHAEVAASLTFFQQSLDIRTTREGHLGDVLVR